MRNSLLTLIALIFSLTACQGNYETELRANINTTNILVLEMNKIQKNMEILFVENDTTWDDIMPTFRDTKDSINASIAAYRQTDIPTEIEPLRDELCKAAKFMIDAIDNFEELATGINNANQASILLEKEHSIGNKFTEFENNIHLFQDATLTLSKQQKEFARKHNITSIQF